MVYTGSQKVNRMTAKELTTQEKIVEFIKDYRREHGYLPNQAAIAAQFTMSRQNFHYYFKNMMECGELDDFPEYKRYLKKTKGTPDGKNASAA